MPTQNSTSSRRAAPLLVALVLALVAVLVVGSAESASAATPAAAKPATSAKDHGTLALHGDTGRAAAAGRARRAGFAWSGRRILYTESIPAQWDWSLSTAIAKWNSSGGGIKFVKAAKPRKAKLRITMGNIGGAAGMATVGRTRRASVQLSSTYHRADAGDAYNRVQVMGVFAHELGHVLGFEHTAPRCSLMSPVLDVDGCGVLPASLPGFYSCRTIDPALVGRFVRIYGGRASTPAGYCPIDPLPAPLGQVAFTGGASGPVTVSWARPASIPWGTRVEIRSWTAEKCGAVPWYAEIAYASAAAGRWQDPRPQAESATCYRVQMVNRYGAGRTAVSRLMVP